MRRFKKSLRATAWSKLHNIVEDGRVSLMFMVPGNSNVVRVNGTAHLSVSAAHLARFERNGRKPRSVVAVSVSEVYSQCARAVGVVARAGST